MWTKYFKMVGIRRGRVITPRHGEIDFSRDDISVEICQQLYEEDFPYLEITEEGKKELYGVEPDLVVSESDAVFEPLPPAEEKPDELKTSIPIKKKHNKKSSE